MSTVRVALADTARVLVLRMAISRFALSTLLYTVLAILLPIGFHQFGLGGRIWLPMHIPALLAGFLAGPFSGLLVGVMGPATSHLLTGMPPSYAVPLMSMELAMYGLVAGICYGRLRLNIYLSLILTMIVGRILFGLGIAVLGSMIEIPYTASQWFSSAGAMVTGWPGLLVQLAVIPMIVAGWKRTRQR